MVGAQRASRSLSSGFESFEVLKPFLDEVESQVPPFAPRVVRIKTREDEAVAEGGDDDEEAVRQLSAKLESFLPSLSNVNISAAEFEKVSLRLSAVADLHCPHSHACDQDDDSNGHINFVTAASNLRARNYKIKEASRHQVKMIAGKIVPAIATTTCMITGLVCLEIYKVLKGGNADNTHNSYVNLAVNVYSMANPQPPKKNVSKVRL